MDGKPKLVQTMAEITRQQDNARTNVDQAHWRQIAAGEGATL